MGQAKCEDLTGRHFNFLTAVKRAPNHITVGGHSTVMWECECECGRKKIVAAGHLRSGHTKSCGKCGLNGPSHELDDLTGRQFDFLKALRRAENHVSSGGNSFAAWECECECGNIIMVTSAHLKTGHTRSCGKCGKFDHSVDFTKQHIGRLTVLEKSDEWYTYPNGDRAQFLDEHGISYVSQKFYPDLFGVGGRHLFYDFCIEFQGITVLVECQGLQHYKPIDYFGGDESFKRQVEHDRRKREYAMSHNIPLIELDCSDMYAGREMYIDIFVKILGSYVQL